MEWQDEWKQNATVAGLGPEILEIHNKSVEDWYEGLQTNTGKIICLICDLGFCV